MSSEVVDEGAHRPQKGGDSLAFPIDVTHCIHGLGLGGAQQIIKLLVSKGDSSRFRHTVYSVVDGILAKEIEKSGARIRIVPRRLPKLDPWHVEKLAKLMRQERPALIHTHLFGDSLHGVLASRRAGSAPVVMTLHNVFGYFSSLQQLGYRWLSKRVAQTVACSDSVRDSFVAAWGERSPDIRSIPNGIDATVSERPSNSLRATLRARLNLDAELVVVASIGRLEAEKGQHHLVRGFARCCRETQVGAKLIFLGEGSLTEPLRDLARAEGIADRVLFAGFRSDLDELLPALDVVAFSSKFEGLSMAMLEAMAAGLCIVGTDIPGITQAVRDDCQGLIVPVGDDEALGQALAKVVPSRQLRERLGQAAQRTFVEKYQASRMVRSYEDLYSEILARRGSGLP